jgi:hypothetical protein
MSLTKDSYAVYLPAVNDGYAATISKPLPEGRPFPANLTLRDLIFWEPNALWHYPYLLHSVGLYSVGNNPDNAVTQRSRTYSILVGDSGGYQIGKGTMKGLVALKPRPMVAAEAEQAWNEEYIARKWIVGWLSTNADYAMTIDMPLWATASAGENSPFHHCTADQLTAMTVNNLKFIEKNGLGRTKWLNVVQGGADTSEIRPWWDAIKWFKHGGWAMAGSAGAKGGLAGILGALLMMRDEGAFDAGQDWVHVLGVSTPTWAVMLSGIQQALRHINPVLRVSFDSSSPFQHGGKFEKVTLTPTYTNDKKSWDISSVAAPQSKLHADPSSTVQFPYGQSPLGQRLQLNHLSVRGDDWDQRNFDSISNMLLTNHNVWVYLDAFQTANDLAMARDADRVPATFISALDCIADLFQRTDWSKALADNRPLFEEILPFGY